MSTQPCIAHIGPGGSGHYVKMVHNGIQVGMLSALSEALSLLRVGLGLNNNEIGNIFAEWIDEGELHRNYLVQIGSEICKKKDQRSGHDDGYMLDEILDKIVQDDDDTERTPTWAIMESVSRHVSCPTLAAGLYLRTTASGNRAEKLKVAQNMSIPAPRALERIDKRPTIELIRRAVYCAFLASYCQGLELIARASLDENWEIDLGECVRIWRAGSIIQSEYIADLLQPALSGHKHCTNMKLIQQVSTELQQNYIALKNVVIKGTETDHYLPALSATLEYIKCVGRTKLPTQFMEAEMDYL